jgi:hypothetical protein
MTATSLAIVGHDEIPRWTEVVSLALWSSSGSLAIFAAIRRASSREQLGRRIAGRPVARRALLLTIG